MKIVLTSGILGRDPPGGGGVGGPHSEAQGPDRAYLLQALEVSPIRSGMFPSTFVTLAAFSCFTTARHLTSPDTERPSAQSGSLKSAGGVGGRTTVMAGLAGLAGCGNSSHRHPKTPRLEIKRKNRKKCLKSNSSCRAMWRVVSLEHLLAPLFPAGREGEAEGWQLHRVFWGSLIKEITFPHKKPRIS